MIMNAKKTEWKAEDFNCPYCGSQMKGMPGIGGGTCPNTKCSMKVNIFPKEEPKPAKEPKLCEHCGMDLALRNPSGKCDHLYYPEACEICDMREQARRGVQTITYQGKRYEIPLSKLEDMVVVDKKRRFDEFCAKLMELEHDEIDWAQTTGDIHFKEKVKERVKQRDLRIERLLYEYRHSILDAIVGAAMADGEEAGAERAREEGPEPMERGEDG
jgi:hypothetical protein